jgi:SAM-dependent methyltransferase
MPKEKAWQNRWANKDKWPESRFAMRVFAFLKNKKVSTLLDIGCGGGRDAVYFSKKGLQVVALDNFESEKQQVKLQQAGVKFINDDIVDINFKPASFDVIYAHLSLHYFNDKTTTDIFKKLHKILKPKGYLFVKCKSTDDPLFGKGRKIEENLYEFEHRRHFFTKEYMENKLQDFKIIKIQKTNSFTHPSKASFIEAFARKK